MQELAGMKVYSLKDVCKLLKIVIDKEWKFVYEYFSMVEISCW